MTDTTVRAGVTSAPAAGRRVTPAGRLILPASVIEQDREAWLRVRRGGIGSSDIAAILDMSKYGTALGVYHDKRGDLPLEGDDSEPALWGRLNEENVAREWARRNRSVVRKVGIIANVDRPWQMCTLDRRVLECPLNRETRERCAVEVKCRDKMKAGQWRRGCPDDVLAQVLWQMDVCGFDHLHVMVLIGGNDPRQFTVWRREHEQVITDLRAAGGRLWTEHILPGRPPALTGSEDPGALLDLYNELHPDRGGVVHLDRDLDAQDDLADYLDAAVDEAEAKKRKATAMARLIGRLGDAEMAVLGDRPAFSYEETSREYVDRARLREEFPDAYEACVEDRASRRLNIPRRVREEHAR